MSEASEHIQYFHRITNTLDPGFYRGDGYRPMIHSFRADVGEKDSRRKSWKKMKRKKKVPAQRGSPAVDFYS